MKIQGINGYNTVQASNLGEAKRLEPGNYICKILNIKCENNKKGNPMLVLQFDISEGDYANWYMNSYNNAVKQDGNAKFKGLYYQNMSGKSLSFYKGVITAIEKSNNIKLDGENGFDGEVLKGKIFLGRFGEEEYLGNDNKVKTITRLRFITSTDKKELPILGKLILKDTHINQNDDNFYTVEGGVEDDMLPF